MRSLAILIVGLSLAACAGGGARDGGIATYDAIKQAQAACAAGGGQFQLKTEGNASYLEDYVCRKN